MNVTGEARARRSRARRALAAVILVAWAAALGGLVQRDVMRTPVERLAEVAMRVNPSNVFYQIEDGGRLIGWGSSTIDTVADTLALRDELAADVRTGGATRRVASRTQVIMSRSFAMRSFVFESDTGAGAVRVSGRPDGDSGVVYVVERGGVRGDSQRVRAAGPVLVPPLLPLATVLRGTPKVGKRVTYATFDPATHEARDITVRILAESLFVVHDSAQLEPSTGRWVPALRDTMRAWRVTAEDVRLDAWVDAQGRPVETTELGALRLRRAAFEMSFENWRLDARDAAQTAAGGDADDIVRMTPIAAGRAGPSAVVRALTARLITPSLAQLDVRGGRQTVNGNVVHVRMDTGAALRATYTLPPRADHRARFRAELEAEPFLQTRSAAILRQTIAIVRNEREPGAIVALLVKWVADSVSRATTDIMPDAAQVLATRRGDAREHALLFTALARSLDVPTRMASGLLLVDGKFYVHTWAEVFLGDWVAVDPTYGQFPADAARLRLLAGGVGRHAELDRILPTLHADVVDSR